MAQNDIRGTVTDEQGNVIPNARVYLFRMDTPQTVVSTTADGNGQYVFESHPDSTANPQQWFVAAEYTDGGGTQYNVLGQPYVQSPMKLPIPDSGDLHAHYDFTKEDGTTPVIDQSGNGNDLSGTYSGVSRNINGVQAGDFDGGDDNLTTSFAAQSQPNHIFTVVQPDSISGNVSPFDADTAANQLIFVTGSSNNWAIYSGAAVEDGSADTSAVIISGLYNGASSAIRVNGVETTGDAGTASLDGISLGARGDGTNPFDGKIGEVLFYPQDKSGIVSDVESYLSDKWGITL